MSNQEVLNPTFTIYGLALLLIIGGGILICPKGYGLAPLISAACTMPIGQQIIIGDIHLHFIRIIIFLGWIRLIIRKEIRSLSFSELDKIMLLYVCVGLINNLILWGSYEAFKGQLGATFNILGIYFFCRLMVNDLEDIKRIINFILFISIPLAFLMIYEEINGINLISLLCHLPSIPEWRNGHYRCQGPFLHPILAGSFGASLLPLIVGMALNQQKKLIWYLIALAASSVVMILSFSSGPLMAYTAGLLGMVCWLCRKQLKMIRRGAFIMIITLHVAMNAPVWVLFARLGDIFGGGGYHRYAIIDQAIAHIGDWWMFGTRITSDWMPYNLISSGSADITNQFIAEGVSSGLAKMLILIWIIVNCFKNLGKAIEKKRNLDQKDKFLIFSVGVCILVHVISFFSVSYFDQIIVFWYLNIAFVSTVTIIPPKKHNSANAKYKNQTLCYKTIKLTLGRKGESRANIC